MSARCHRGTSRPLPRTGQPRNNPEVLGLSDATPTLEASRGWGRDEEPPPSLAQAVRWDMDPANRQQIDRDGSLQVLTLPSEIGVPSMCDYSLELVASRPAKVGDKLVSKSFPQTFTRGFVSVDDT